MSASPDVLIRTGAADCPMEWIEGWLAKSDKAKDKHSKRTRRHYFQGTPLTGAP